MENYIKTLVKIRLTQNDLWKSCGNPVEIFYKSVEIFSHEKVFHRKLSFPQVISKSFPQSVENFYVNVDNKRRG